MLPTVARELLLVFLDEASQLAALCAWSGVNVFNARRQQREYAHQKKRRRDVRMSRAVARALARACAKSPENAHFYAYKSFKSCTFFFDVISIKVLNDREKEILYSRRLNDNPMTLEDLSKKYKISRERVRQIENKAFEKLQKHMLLLAKSKNLLPAN